MLGGVHAALLLSSCTLAPPHTTRPTAADAGADVRVDGSVSKAAAVTDGERINAAVSSAAQQGQLPASSTLNLYAPVDGRLPPDEPHHEHSAAMPRARAAPVKFARSLLSKYFKTAKLVAPPPLLFSDTLRGAMQL